MSDKQLLQFFSEAGLLKRVRRSGWQVLGIKDSESVAEHSFRCAVIGYTIAKLEGADCYKALLMCLFNDLHEARIGDLHKMSQPYFKDFEKAEDKAFDGQIKFLPKQIKEELTLLRKNYRGQNTKESIIARDADILECLLQAKEYKEYGFNEAVRFMKKAPNFLKTKTAKALWNTAKNTNLNEWWLSLSKFKR